jgi:lipoprotein-anchoring transpeptidase ErfK/SrfK
MSGSPRKPPKARRRSGRHSFIILAQWNNRGPARRRVAFGFIAMPKTLAQGRRPLLVAVAAVLTISCGGARARPAETAPPREALAEAATPGTIVISQSQRRLFLIERGGRAISYPIAIGMPGRAWLGWARVSGKYVEPAWSPPADVKRDHPRMPDLIPGGAPNNPMGARALTLDRTEIAIHGTTASMRRSIGGAASYGCIRMYNEDVIDLFDRVDVGAPVLAVH